MNNNIYLLDIFVNYLIIENSLTHLEGGCRKTIIISFFVLIYFYLMRLNK